MKGKAARRSTLQGWAPIVGAFTIWFAHFLLVYAAALIWPHQSTAIIVSTAVTVVALVALLLLFLKLRSTTPTSGQTLFARRFGMGSIFIASAGTLFDAAPALFG